MVDGVPCLTRFATPPTARALKAFSAGLSICGNISLFHLEGVTPDSEDPELVALIGEIDHILVSDEDLGRVYGKLAGPTGARIDCVAIGCPHLDMSELREVAKVLERKRKRVLPKVRAWIFMSKALKDKADQEGSRE